MAKVFVSYSRKDIEFAKRLTTELQKGQLDFWIDWEGIPPTVDWWREIEKGIEEADAFLFLISPDSARSKVCGREIDVAVKNGKRIIPVVVREIEWDDTPPKLGHLNYIFFSQSDDFDTAVKKLTIAIHSDYEWAATPRRLQIKALEWERNHKENSFLLRGKDLQDAELQLATNTSKDPYPTDLQREYVFGSRTATDRQRRNITSIAIMGFVVMTLLTVFAFTQLNISRAQQLGAQAEVAFAQRNYNAALLYAYQSNIIHKNRAADLVLGQLPYENFFLGKTLSGHTDTTNDVAWSPSGQLASASSDNTVILWDLNTGRPIQTLKGHTRSVNDVAWSPSGQLASASSDGTVIIWDLNTGRPAQILKGHTDSGNAVAWSPSGQLASTSSDNTVILWDLNTGQPAQILKGHTDSGNAVAWSPSGQLASASSDNTVILWDLNTGKPAQTLNGEYIYSLAWSPSGQLASASNDGTVIIWDLNTGQPAQTLKGHKTFVNAVAWSPSGQLASASNDGTVIIWDLNTGQPAQTLKGHESRVSAVAWSPSGQLASASFDGTVIIWDLNTGQPAQRLNSSDRSLPSESLSLAWSPKGQLASAGFGETVIIWDINTSQRTQTLKDQNAFLINGLAWSPNGQLASASWDGTVVIWDLNTGRPLQTLKGLTGSVNAVAWSSSGQLASASSDNTVIIWDLNSGRPAQRLKGHKTFVNAVAWSPSGQLASSSSDGTVIIWDLNTGRPAQTLAGHMFSVKTVAWSPSGQLASGSVDGTVKTARTDLISGNLCNKIFRNMTTEEWLDYQGALYIYKPACANLYDPTTSLSIQESIVFGDVLTPLITLRGRVILLALLLVLLAVVIFIVLALYRSVASLLQRYRKRKQLFRA